MAGTRFGIGVDAATGLLRGGADGWALTWMDARIDGRPVTPRAGFPVEIEALWVNGLGTAADLLTRVGQRGDVWSTMREQAVESFGQRFWLGTAGLADLVDTTGVAVPERRPNQLLAVSLPHAPVTDPDQVAQVVAACRSDLLTSVGLRSLVARRPGISRATPGQPCRA